MYYFFKKNRWLIFSLFVLVLVILINIFPRGYVFGGGDTAQFIEAKSNLKNLFYGKGEITVFFYAIFSFLDWSGVSNSTQLSLYLGIFIFGAFLSFYLFSKLIFPEAEKYKKNLTSLFYALNLYTLFLFTGNWGYSYFPTLYIFLPLLVGLYIKFLKTQKNIYGVFFILTVFIGSSGFGNPAFLLSFTVLLATLLIALLIFKYIRLNKALVLKIFLLAIFLFLASSFWLLPLIPEIKKGISGLQSSDVVEFNWWIRKTASPIIKTLSLNHFSEAYFPYNFYYKNLISFKSLFLFLSFLPIIIITLGILFKRKILSDNDRFFWIFIFVLGFFTILVARLTFPFEVLNYYIYHLPGFVTLRGYDKTAIFIPFLLSALLLAVINNLRSKKILLILLFLILLTPLPFFLGKLQQTAGYRVNSEKNYQNASMSFLVKIPDEYYDIRNIVNFDQEKSFIATLPETYNDGTGIVYYPKWNLYGWDITHYLFNKNFVEANGFYFRNWNFAKEFNQEAGSPKWLPKILGIMNSKYIIYHKDAPDDSVIASQYKMQALEREELIKSLSGNDYFTLYEIDRKLILPYISYQKESFDWRNDPVWIERNAKKIIEASTEVSVREINPKKFEVNFKESEFSKNIILAEKYDPLWKAYVIDKDDQETELKNHFLARGYANGWEIPQNMEIEKIIIEYYPIRLMWRGIWISGVTVLFLLGYLIRYWIVIKSKVIKSKVV